MLYDSSYHGGPRPGAPRPSYTPAAVAPQTGPSRQYFRRPMRPIASNNPAPMPMGFSGGQYQPEPMQQAGMYSPQMPTYGGMGAMPVLKNRRRPWMYDRNGKAPGMWDYRPEPMYQSPQYFTR